MIKNINECWQDYVKSSSSLSETDKKIMLTYRFDRNDTPEYFLKMVTSNGVIVVRKEED